jgi:hypothetical protein
MQVFVIDPSTKETREEQITEGDSGVRQLIGFDSIDFDEIDDNGDRLYFDESCFIRHGADVGRFRVDSLAPVAGKGVITGGEPGGKTIAGAQISIEALRARVQFL